MQLGAFSISLSVKDLQVSRAFYETLGFKTFAGTQEHKYLIMVNGPAVIGLFEGMFQGNMLTFNPGWNPDASLMETFDDVRAIQAHLKAHGISPVTEADESTTGPAHFVVKDPDGNVILVDQHR